MVREERLEAQNGTFNLQESPGQGGLHTKSQHIQVKHKLSCAKCHNKTEGKFMQKQNM